MSHTDLDLGAYLRGRGYRLTPQRHLILDTICVLGAHVTVEEICRQAQAQAPGLNRATVYRTLNFFIEMRLIVSTEMDGKTWYELAAPERHHHLHCRDCGHVFQLPAFHLESLFTYLRQEHQFEPELDHLTIPGLCRHCQPAGA